MIKDYEHKRSALLNNQSYCCYSCGKPFKSNNEVQLAHRLIKSKSNIKLYGLDVIDNVKNLRATHGGYCNDSVIINTATQPVKASELVNEILNDINNKM